jgi:hypothetical protein
MSTWTRWTEEEGPRALGHSWEIPMEGLNQELDVTMVIIVGPGWSDMSMDHGICQLNRSQDLCALWLVAVGTSKGPQWKPRHGVPRFQPDIYGSISQEPVQMRLKTDHHHKIPL